MNLHRLLCLLIAFGLVAKIANGSEWETEYEKALANAKAAKKCVLFDFTGSDWCGPCIIMKKSVFSKAPFLNYAKEKLVLIEVDYPRIKTLSENIRQQNQRLFHQYHIESSGFPTVILLNPDGKVLGEREGYSGEGPADIIAWVERLCGKSS